MECSTHVHTLIFSYEKDMSLTQRKPIRYVFSIGGVTIFLAVVFWFGDSLAALAQWDPSRLPGISGLPYASVSDIVRSLLDWLLYIVGFVAVLGFLWAGLLFLISGGSEQRVERAKSAFLYSIVGVIVALIGVIAVRWIDNFLRAQLP